MYIKKIVANMNPILVYGQQMSLLRCLFQPPHIEGS